MSSSNTIIEISADLSEKVDNRYALVLEISEIAKRLLDEAREKVGDDPFASIGTSPEKVIYQALIMKASQIDMGDDQLIG
jgi:hypothetical protein